MEVTRADYLLPDTPMRQGNTVRTTRGTVYDNLTEEQERSVRNDPAGNGLSLSRVGQTIADLAKDSHRKSSNAASTFTSFINSVHQQVLADGIDALLFKEEPNVGTADRLTLAKQASNCLSVSYYGGEKVHADISARNPFASLDRLSLSQIAFDDSGTFTSVERQVAYLEMSDRDISFRSEVYNLGSTLGGNDSVPWHDIVSRLGDAQISSAMSDAERSWLGWGTARGLLASATALAGQYGVETPSLPLYTNLNGRGESILTVTVGSKSEAAWESISMKHFSAANFGPELSNLIAIVGSHRDAFR